MVSCETGLLLRVSCGLVLVTLLELLLKRSDGVEVAGLFWTESTLRSWMDCRLCVYQNHNELYCQVCIHIRGVCFHDRSGVCVCSGRGSCCELFCFCSVIFTPIEEIRCDSFAVWHVFLYSYTGRSLAPLNATLAMDEILCGWENADCYLQVTLRFMRKTIFEESTKKIALGC